MKVIRPLILFVLCIGNYSILIAGNINDRLNGYINVGQKFVNYNLFNLLPNQEELKAKIKNDVKDPFFLKLDSIAINRLEVENTDFISIDITTINQTYKLFLKKNEAFTNDGQIKTAAEIIDKRFFGSYYSGLILNDSNGFATLTLVNNEIVIGIFNQAGNFYLSKYGEENSTYIFYQSQNYLTVNNAFVCNNETNNADGMTIGSNIDQLNKTQIPNCVQLYWEIDYSLYNDFSQNISTTLAFVSSIFNNHAALFDNEGITVRLKTLFLNKANIPAYNLNLEDNDLLKDVQNNVNSFDGDIANFLFSGGGSGKAAGFNALFNGYNYKDGSLCVTRIAPSLTLYLGIDANVFVVTHEEGHLLGSRHTHWCGWNNGPIDNCACTLPQKNNSVCPEVGPNGPCTPGPLPTNGGGTIMSYCLTVPNVGVNFANGFGTQPKALILNNISSSPYLSSCGTSCNSVYFYENCNDAFGDNSGASDYDNNMKCHFLIAPSQTNVASITVNFASFNTSTNDKVYVYQGSSVNDPLIDVFSGNLNPFSFTINGDKVLIVFDTDGSVTAPGWDLTYQCNNCKCNPLTLQVPALILTPTANFTSIALAGGEHSKMNVVAGNTYEFSLCASDQGYSPYNAKINLYKENDLINEIFCSDDQCDYTSPKIIWNNTSYTGVVRVVLNKYPCKEDASPSTLRYKCSSCSVVNTCACAPSGSSAGGTLTPTYLNQTTNMSAGQYATFQLTGGQSYRFSTCAANGGSNGGQDLKLTLYDASQASTINDNKDCNDNTCGNDPEINFYSPITKTYRVYANVAPNCGVGGNITLSYKCITCSGGGNCTTPSDVVATYGADNCGNQGPGNSAHTLTWNDVGANGYNISYSKYPFGTSNIVCTHTCATGTNLFVAANTLESGMVYRYNMRACNGCPNDASKCLSVNFSNTKYFHVPPVINANGPTSLCNGNSVILSAQPVSIVQGTVTYKWYKNGSNYIGSGTSQSVNQPGAYHVTITYSGSSTCTTSITTDPSNTITITTGSGQQAVIVPSSPTVCDGISYNFQVSPGDPNATYQWTVPSGWAIINGSNSYSMNVMVSSNSGYVACNVTNSCYTSPAALYVPVSNISPATGPIYGPIDLCKGETYTFYVDPVPYATQYNWNFPTGFLGYSNSNTISVTVDPNYNFNWYSADIYCLAISPCGSYGGSQKSINYIKDGITSADFNFTVSGSTVYFNASASGSWQNMEFDFGDGYTQAGSIAQHTFAPNSSNNVCLTVFSANGCSNKTVCKTVNVGAPICVTPQAPTTYGNTNCTGPWQSNYSNGVPFMNATWTHNSNTSNYDFELYEYPYDNVNLIYSSYCLSTKSLSLDNTVLQNGKKYAYRVRATEDCNGCNSVWSDFNYYSIYPILNSTNLLSCDSSPVILSTPAVYITPPAYVTYNWVKGSNFISVQNTTSNTYQATESGDYRVQLVYNGSTTCPLPDTGMISTPAYIVISSSPPAPIITANNVVCEGGDVVMSATPQGYGNNWSGPNGFTNYQDVATLHNVSLSDSGEYICIQKNAAGCYSAPSSIIINVNAVPKPAFTFTNWDSTYTFDNQSQSAESYLWDFGDGSTDTSSNPVHSYLNPGIYNVCLTASNIDCGSQISCNSINIGDDGATVANFAKQYFIKDTTYNVVVQLQDFYQEITDSSYYFIGSGLSNTNFDYEIIILKTDKNGNTLWKRAISNVYGLGYNNYRIFKLGGDIYISYQTNKNGFERAISKISNLGLITSTKLFKDNATVFPLNTGYFLAMDKIGNNPILISLADSNLNTIWTKEFGIDIMDADYINIGAAIITQSQEIILAGSINKSNNFKPMLLRLDFNGNLINIRLEDNSTSNEGYTSILQLSNSNIIASGYRSEKALLSKFDQNLNPITTLEVDSTISSAQITQATNNEFFVVYPIQGTRNKVLKLNSNLNILGGKVINKSPMVQVFKFTLDNNFCVMGAGATNTQFTNRYTSVIKQSFDFESCLSSDFTPNPVILGATTSSATPLIQPTANVQDTTLLHSTSNFSFLDSNLCFSCNLSASISSNNGNTLCFSDSVILTSNNVSVNYLWSTGATTKSIVVKTPGTYMLDIAEGACSSTVSFAIQGNPQIISSLTTDSCICNADSTGKLNLTASGGSGGLNYLWNNSVTTMNILQAAAGFYSVTITDVKGCSTTATAIVHQPNQISINPTLSTPTCPFGLNGAMNIIVNGGAAPLTFLWNNGNTTTSLSNIAAGTYTVIVSDSKGCSNASAITLSDPNIISNQVFLINPNCNSGNNGSIELETIGGTAPYTYLWSNGNTNSIASGLVSGSYVVTITDANNCTASFSQVITQPSALVINETISQPTCSSLNNGSIDITVNGGGGNYQYLWNDGTTNAVIDSIFIGAYTITVTDSLGCVIQKSFVLNNVDSLLISASIANAGCGISNGAITIAVTQGSGTYSYLWSNGNTTDTINQLQPGVYTVTVTDNGSCSQTATYSIQQNSLFSVQSLVNYVSCFGLSDGSISTQVSGGNPPFTYLWSNGGTTNGITNLNSNSYSVLITDGAGCTTVENFSITEPPALQVSKQVNDVSCSGLADGSVSLFTSGGTTPYNYLWSNGNTNSSVSQLNTGSYSITITDANGCFSNTSITINSPLTLSINITSTVASCNIANGVANCTASNGNGGYLYLWNNGSTISSLTNVFGGIYTVTVADSKGCSISATVNLSNPNTPTLSLNSKTNVTCFGSATGSIDILKTGGTPPFNYLWNDGSTTQDLNNRNAGFYAVTITDINGCTATYADTIFSGIEVEITPTTSNVLCGGAATGSISINVNGGQPGYTFQWSNNLALNSYINSNLAAGTYTVTVTDGIGCSKTTAFQIDEPNTLGLSPSSTPTVCNGSTGTAFVYVTGGVQPYQYEWSNNTYNNFVQNLSAGVYIVTVTDAYGCSNSTSVQVTTPDGPSILIDTVQAISCNGLIDGKVHLSITNGTAPYTYTWTNGATVQDLNNLASGQYSVVVTDANGCTTIGSFSIVEPDLISIAGTINNVSCNGGNDGAILTNAIGGTLPFQYLWSLSNTTSSLINLGIGTYTVTITDNNGCTKKNSFTIIQPTALLLSDSIRHLICANDADGFIFINATGSNGSFSYQWNNGSTDSALQNLSGGNYTVTVTDSLGCYATKQITLNEPLAMTVNSTISDVICNGAATGSVTTAVNGGTGNKTYLWSSGATSNSISNVLAGTYTVTVTDANNCTIQMVNTITQPQAINLTSTVVTNQCFGDSTGSIVVNAAGGASPYDFLWSNGKTTSNIINMPAGTYSLTVTDNSNCTFSASLLLTEPGQLNASVTLNAQQGYAFAIANGGVAPYSYIWQNELDSSIVSTLDTANLTAGTYYLTVIDSNACQIILPVFNINTGFASSSNETQVLLYPNPFTNELYISISKYKSSLKKIEIIDMQGRIIYFESIDNKSNFKGIINTLGFSKGIYVLRIHFNTGPEVFKLVKQ